ncbi:S41 family peptidase [Siphonobacter sp. SORGH_AS_0500]|uniref:S41 family peptidase n=1 Tax=Siphonobacter sp. SORGH_AS_0500 TaxID=1864824 RepID=UPI00285B1444|nr:S41 family peptidase [Siphonobacter sp. SORGH_AS_0500]MDR6197049.1 carboxyl-terminal processing protease [Siphonobacter sp. SORGH_AS_0500]
MKIFHHFLIYLTVVLLAASCKKDEKAITPTPTPTTKTADVRDSVYFLSQELYLWSDKLPSLTSFNPTSYATPQDVMKKVRTYSPLGTKGTNLDRWSFAILKSDWDNVASGTEGDIGVGFRFAAANDLRIAYVYANSSAGKQGVQRGWQVVSINNVAATTANVDALNTELAKASISVAFKKLDGSSTTLNLTSGSYQTNPVLTRSVIEQNGKKIGYIAFNSFLGSTASADLDEAFSYLKSNQVTELIFDERYNGGGYVNLAVKIANLIAPSTAAGKLMYKDTHNSKYASWNKTVNFESTLPASNLNLSKVVFITTNNTASASELLINALKPYMTVKLVGGTTYGKPAGYYGLPTMDYYAFPLAVKQVNANNYGDYYDGLTVDREQADDVSHNWGDPQERCIKDAVTYLTTGQFPTSSGRIANFDKYNERLQTELTLPGVLLTLPKKSL